MVKASYIEVETIFCNNGFEPLTWHLFLEREEVYTISFNVEVCCASTISFNFKTKILKYFCFNSRLARPYFFLDLESRLHIGLSAEEYKD